MEKRELHLSVLSSMVQFSSVQSLSRVLLFVTPWTLALQASLSITNSQSLLRLMSVELLMPFNHLMLCCPLLLLPSVFPSIRVIFSISPSIEYSGLISLRMDWFNLLVVQGTLKSLLQHHSSKASISWHSVFLYGPTLTSMYDYWKNHSFD